MDQDQYDAIRLRLDKQLKQLEKDPSIPKELIAQFRKMLEAGPSEALQKMARVLEERRKPTPKDPDKKA